MAPPEEDRGHAVKIAYLPHGLQPMGYFQGDCHLGALGHWMIIAILRQED